MNEQNGGSLVYQSEASLRSGSQNTQFKCVKEEHPDNQQDGGDNLDYMDEVPNGSIPEKDITDNEYSDDEYSEEEQYKSVHTGGSNNLVTNQNINQRLNNNQQKERVIIKNFRDVQTINNVNSLNKKLVEVINNFNGHIKKLYNDKADKTYVSKLHNQIQHMNVDIQALRRTLTEQSRMVGNVSNVYRHSKKHKSKSAKKIKNKIETVIKQKAGNNVKPDEVLNSVKQTLETNKQSINKSYELINLFTDRVNQVENKINDLENKVDVIDKSNNILIKNSKRYDDNINITNSNKNEIDALKREKPDKNDVINLIYLILERTDVNVNKEMIKDLLEGKLKNNNNKNIKEQKKEKITTNKENVNDKHIGEREFKEDMDNLINKMRLTKNDDLNKTTIKNMKRLIEKYDKFGHIDDIRKYTEQLPRNKTKNNKKKAVMRKHLHVHLKNRDVK